MPGSSGGGRLGGLAIIPAAPVLVPEATAVLPEGADVVQRHVRAAVASLPRIDVIAVVAGGEPAVHVADVASLSAVGHPGVARNVVPARDAAERAATATGLPLVRAASLPIDLAALALQVAHDRPDAKLLAVSASPTAHADALAALGGALVRSIVETTAVVVAGDLSAARDERSPRWKVPGAVAWDERVVSEVDSGRLRGIGRLGPEEALRVHARGWPALAVLHGVTEAAKVGLVLRHVSAPRGVGYLVAVGG